MSTARERGSGYLQGPNNRGHYMTPTQTRHYQGELPENYHTFVLFDSPNMGPMHQCLCETILDGMA